MVKMDLISIIVPAYNVENYLEECIYSLTRQSYRNIEIIIVDDGSNDSTPEKCDYFSGLDERIKVFHKANGGLSDARNYGIKKSVGQYIGFVDSDDWVSDNMFEVLYNECITNDADIAVCGMHRVYADATDSFIPSDTVLLNSDEAIYELLKGEQFGDQSCTKLYRRELFDNIQFPKNKLYEDIYTTYRLFLSSDRVMVINQGLYYYRQRKSSITRSKFNIRSLDIVKALDTIANDPRINKRDELIQLIEKRKIDAECWLLLDYYQSDLIGNTEESNVLHYLFYSVKRNRRIAMSSQYKSCRLVAYCTLFGFTVSKVILSSAIINRIITGRHRFFS